ncbi:hypothetical protein HDE_02307 [Halotydeus destructor]|nr:hypothetical protein HDE_02307 [Halotydeus destructor]
MPSGCKWCFSILCFRGANRSKSSERSDSRNEKDGGFSYFHVQSTVTTAPNKDQLLVSFKYDVDSEPEVTKDPLLLNETQSNEWTPTWQQQRQPQHHHHFNGQQPRMKSFVNNLNCTNEPPSKASATTVANDKQIDLPIKQSHQSSGHLYEDISANSAVFPQLIEFGNGSEPSTDPAMVQADFAAMEQFFNPRLNAIAKRFFEKSRTRANASRIILSETNNLNVDESKSDFISVRPSQARSMVNAPYRAAALCSPYSASFEPNKLTNCSKVKVGKARSDIAPLGLAKGPTRGSMAARDSNRCQKVSCSRHTGCDIVRGTVLTDKCPLPVSPRTGKNRNRRRDELREEHVDSRTKQVTAGNSNVLCQEASLVGSSSQVTSQDNSSRLRQASSRNGRSREANSAMPIAALLQSPKHSTRSRTVQSRDDEESHSICCQSDILTTVSQPLIRRSRVTCSSSHRVRLPASLSSYSSHQNGTSDMAQKGHPTKIRNKCRRCCNCSCNKDKIQDGPLRSRDDIEIFRETTKCASSSVDVTSDVRHARHSSKSRRRRRRRVTENNSESLPSADSVDSTPLPTHVTKVNVIDSGSSKTNASHVYRAYYSSSTDD